MQNSGDFWKSLEHASPKVCYILEHIGCFKLKAFGKQQMQGLSDLLLFFFSFPESRK